jgi:predicted membrane metal-binding protein
MTPIGERSGRYSWVGRMARGALPILICLGFFLSLAPQSSIGVVVGVCAVCAVILWFEWSSVRRNVVTKWIGVILSLFVGLILGLAVLGVIIRIGPFLFLIFLVALPFVSYDLLFRATADGRAERDRGEPPQLGS